MTSIAEQTLAVQLEQAGIPFGTEVSIAKPRRFRWDFIVSWNLTADPPTKSVLVEIDGGGWINGRHSRGNGMEQDAEKSALAAIRGYRVIRCTPRQVDDGRALSWIRQALGLEQAA